MTYRYLSFSKYLISLLIFSYSCEQAKSIREYGPETLVITENIEEEPSINTSPDSLMYCITSNNIGVGGYDLISYFEKNIAEKGSPSLQYIYDGVNYNFTNKEHKNTFVKNPEKYLPAFGGWCSMTLAMGRATTPTYDNFKIINDKLYLFERTLSINGRILWDQNPKENKKVAKKNYLDYLEDGVINTN